LFALKSIQLNVQPIESATRTSHKNLCNKIVKKEVSGEKINLEKSDVQKRAEKSLGNFLLVLSSNICVKSLCPFDEQTSQCVVLALMFPGN
jgi:hypothetical protein